MNYSEIMSEEKKITIGLHLVVFDKVVKDEDSLKQLEDTIQVCLFLFK